ncbi:MAG TPA: CoA transferase [Acidimicrobiales bacterium]|jgi:crotonobetainyl-CoA:carnitine CoA-transferase CaiB-like acyl-CoA transferase
MSGPLDGLLVVDASWGMPGSVTTLLLADYGARVVKLERPGGGPDGGSVNRSAWDRGKWSAELDFTDPADLGQLLKLTDRADVLVESFGVGGATALGMGYEAVHARNPALVYCSLTGYGLDAHPWRDRPGFDCLVAARMGFMAEQPGHRDGPIFLGHPSVGYTTAFLATLGILSALRARSVTGEGQQVDVSLLDGVIGQAPMNWWWNERDDSYLTTQDKGVFGNRRIIMEMFPCADGEYLMVHTGGQGSFKATMDLLGLGDKIRPITDRVEMSVPLDDDEYVVTRELVPTAWLAKPRAEWLKLLHDADVAAVPVLRPGEVIEHEQVDFAGVVVEVEHPDLGTLRQIGPTLRFARTPADRPAAAPAIGEHNGRLDELVGCGPVDRQQPATPLRHALEGIRVLDFSSFFAAAYGARIMSDLGADVIKVEMTSRDPMRSLPDPFEAANRGKRNIVVDLKDAAGLEIARDLVRSADILFHNLRPGKAEKLGIGYEQLAAVNPRLIYCYQPGWGARGPSAGLKSFAPLLSGLTGLMFEAAGEGNGPVRRARASEDYYGALLGAVGALMALRDRDLTGEGQYVESPQLHASLFCTTEQCLDEKGQLVTGFGLDTEQMGYGPLYRLYQTSDGYVCLACVGDGAFARLQAALGLQPDLAPSDGPRLAAALAERFATLSSTDAVARLDEHRVPCEVARAEPFMPQFFWEQWAVDSGRVFEHYHDEFGWVREVGLFIRLSGTPGLNKGPGALFGEHSRPILEELGYSPERIDELVATGACVTVDRAGSPS